MWISAKGTIPLVGLDAAGITQRQGRWPGSLDENLDPPYTSPNASVVIHRLKDSPLRPGHVRAPGKVANCWAVESLVDEIAASVGEDAVAYRLKRLTDPRAVAVVKRAAEMIDWQPRPSPNPKAAVKGKLTGRGFSYVRYRGNENYVAMAMQVAVDPATGKVAVERVVCAHDCGLVVNPDALKNQIEGSIIQSLEQDALRGSEVRPLPRDQRGLGQLSGDPLPRRAADRDRAHRPSRPAVDGRRRSVARARRRSAGERDLRCHRQAAPHRSVHPGASEGIAGVAMTGTRTYNVQGKFQDRGRGVMRLIFRIGPAVCVGGLLVLFAQSDPTEKPARAILETKCAACHGPARMSDLDLRERDTILKGGKRGPAIVPGKADESLLYKAVRREGDVQMPPGKSALTAAEVNAIRDWINAGAKWTSTAPKTAAATWWSFKKPVRPAVPAVKDAARVRNPIDAFILAKLEEKKLHLAPEADRRTLARRAYFDLHGLPPTPEQVEEFVNDKSPDAYEKLVDRLLASPRYGERWGRHWLDLVRYADTSGFETDHFFITAWRYRDWVIESFNRDKPYTTFVQEQIAADELWPTNMELEGSSKLPKEKEENVHRRIGTSLFTIGSFPIEFTYYGDQFRAEWEADAVDTVGAAFLGLTVGCARCHDHKFDPISQRDYYRMNAIFAGSVEREIPLVSQFDIQTASRNFPLLNQAQILKQMAARGGRGGRGGGRGGRGAPDRRRSTRRSPPTTIPPPRRRARPPRTRSAPRCSSSSARLISARPSITPPPTSWRTMTSFPTPTSC